MKYGNLVQQAPNSSMVVVVVVGGEGLICVKMVKSLLEVYEDYINKTVHPHRM